MVVRYGRSRLFKIIEIGISRKPVCDFLLIFHYKYIPIFYCFPDMTIYWSKICFLPTAALLKALARVFPCMGPRVRKLVSNTTVLS